MGAAQSTRDTLLKHVAAAAVKPHDATLAQNLKKIGQVNVPSSPASIQRSFEMTHVLRTRDLSGPHGRTIDSFGLSKLLDSRKDASTPAKEQQLAGLDEGLVKRLAKRYNTPSIGRENTIGLPDGDRRLYREAIWVDAGQANQDSNM